MSDAVAGLPAKWRSRKESCRFSTRHATHEEAEEQKLHWLTAALSEKVSWTLRDDDVFPPSTSARVVFSGLYYKTKTVTSINQ